MEWRWAGLEKREENDVYRSWDAVIDHVEESRGVLLKVSSGGRLCGVRKKRSPRKGMKHRTGDN